MQVFPLTTEPAQRFNLQLSESIYGFRFIYNSRGDYWSMDIYDANNQLLAAGIKIVLGIDLIRAYSLDLGYLIAVNVSDNDEDPGSNAELGKDVLLYHVTESDLIALRSIANASV